MCSEEGILHQNPVAGVQKGDKAPLFYVSNHCFMSSLPAWLGLAGRTAQNIGFGLSTSG